VATTWREAHEALQTLTVNASRLAGEAARSREYYDLGGLGPGDGPEPYTRTLRQIGEAIRRLRFVAREIKALRTHAHEWSADDYCVICGADGRA